MKLFEETKSNLLKSKKQQMIHFSMLLIVMVIFLVNHSFAQGAKVVGQGPQDTAKDYPVGDEKIRFKALIVDTDDNGRLNELALNALKIGGSHIWDDKYYWMVLPDNRPKYLLCAWRNLSSGEYGWALIQNTPTKWFTKTNKEATKSIPDDSQKKWTWSTNGFKVDIDIYNPKNKPPYTANHILYSFGF